MSAALQARPVERFIFIDGGYVRLSQIIHPRGPLPISKSAWWEGVRTRRYPQPIKLGPRITVWRCEDIKAMLENGVNI